LFIVISCSDETLSLFFDIPPPSEKPAPAPEPEPAPAAATAAPATVTAPEGGPPPFESIFDWEQAYELLPKNEVDEEVDWMTALRQGTITPRGEMSGPGNPESRLFKFDFFFAGPDPETDAYFPHSAHTEWLTCESCHPALFPYRELGMEGSGSFSISMDRIFEGEYCGKCHGIVAFELDYCNRCHTKM
jgi:c(7)-type cytochrome triheme protein